MFKNVILPILLSTVWISISEFARNEFLLKQFWTEHYEGMGLLFPSEPVNGMVWGIWSFGLAIGIYYLLQRFSFWATCILVWWFGFVLMWLVTGNMAVLPLGILWYAVPLSMVEVVFATAIIKRLGRPNTAV